MFNLKLKFMLAASILIIGGVTAASAQLTSGAVLKFNVASSFVLRDKSFPAGSYTIERTPSTIDAPTLMIIRGEHQVMVFDTLTARSAEVADNTELVFDTVDGINFLTGIRLKGDDVALEIPKTKNQLKGIAQAAPAVNIVLTENLGL
ncbi:MAG TPA: hypothetical protein VHQ01_05695 [Pyrinomonadaceae bacterium]|nr:hypothetical protein [Pyrinomonadaceae bacterium]